MEGYRATTTARKVAREIGLFFLPNQNGQQGRESKGRETRARDIPTRTQSQQKATNIERPHNGIKWLK